MTDTPPTGVWTGIDTLPPELAARLSVRAGVPFFRSIEWFECLAAHGLQNARPRVYVVAADDAVTALYGLPDGRRLAGLSNFYTLEFGLAGGGDPQPLLDYVAAERPRWHTLELRNLPAAELPALRRAATRSGLAAHAWRQHDNWYLPVDGIDFERYYAGRSSRLRNTIERKQRKARRAHDFRLAIYPRASVSLDDAIDAFQTVYATSWKEPEPFPGFMPALIRVCAALDAARIGLIWIDERPAAAQFWIRDGRRSFVYKLAYDEAYAGLSAGSILSKAMFADAIDVDRVAEIDYGVGSEAYKRDWMSDCRTLHGLLACNRRTVRGLARHLRESLADRLHG